MKAIPGLRRSPSRKRLVCAYCGLQALRRLLGEGGWVPLYKKSSHYFVCPDCRRSPRKGPGLDELGRVKSHPGGNDRPMRWRDRHKHLFSGG